MMNRNKGKKKLTISYDHSKQLSIRSFFSASGNTLEKNTVRDSPPVCGNAEIASPDIINGTPVILDKTNRSILSPNNSANTSPDIIESTPVATGKCNRTVLSYTVDRTSKKRLSYCLESSASKKRKSDAESEDFLEDLEKLSASGSPVKKTKSLSSKRCNEKSSVLEELENSSSEQLSVSSLLPQNKAASPAKNVKSPSKLNLVMYDPIDIENVADLLDGDWGDDFSIENDELQLDTWKYCKVKSVNFCNEGILLRLEEYNKQQTSTASATCLLKGCWAQCEVKSDDIISIKAYYDSCTERWLVDNKQGFLIKYPDMLITGTGIVGSLFCARRSVLSNLFAGSDPPNMTMVIGSLVHELLQEVLRRKLYTVKQMETVVQDLVANKRTLFMAYECDVPLTVIDSELRQFLPRILTFLETYIVGKKNSKKDWPGRIVEILGIEENFWIPHLGIKGKADLTVKVKVDGVEKILPLELKTGRASNSSEHRGQIILYSMMMTELGMNVDSGLLLYLRENVLNEIKPQHPERSGLLNVRNTLVDFYMANETLQLSAENQFELPILPEPINHHSACGKCPYLTVCSASLSKQHRESISEKNPLRELSVKSIEHLTTSHIQYIFQWLGMLKMEEMARKRNRASDISDLWHLDVEKRERRGYCIGKLRVHDIQPLGSKYLHRMRRATQDGYDLMVSGLVEGDYIVISTDSRYAVAAGYVYDVSELQILCKLDKCLEKLENGTYAIDKYSMYDSLLGFNTSSLVLLMENTNQSDRLRSLVIDLQLPKFNPRKKDIHVRQYENILSNLNESQREAILRILETQDYMLIKGMPGTGKTATIVALVKLLVSLKYTILLTSHTHSAVDNILLRLKGEVDFLRLGSSARVHSELKEYCEDATLETGCFNTVDDLEKFYNSKQVVSVTCMGCSHALLQKRMFDFCIVDEATQVLQPAVLKALYSSSRFVLIGDPEQLPPVVQCKDASRLGFSESLFKRLDRPEVTSVLSLQYRMNEQIMKLANSFVYENALKCANDRVSSATISLINSLPETYPQNAWLQLSLSPQLTHSVVLLNTSNIRAIDQISDYSNKTEAHLTFTIVEALLRNCGGANDLDIGIIAPFREQVELLKKVAHSKNHQIEINTVDQYQGRDKDVIIYSCTKSSSTRDSGILSDKRRLTVAITRAKRKLIIIGNVPVLETYTVFKELFNFIPVDNKVDISSM